MKHTVHMTPVSNKTCVLYDPMDGRIVYSHRVLTMPGAREITEEELEKRVMERAKHLGYRVSGLVVLRVTQEEYDGSSQFRVDLATKKLQKIERLTKTL